MHTVQDMSVTTIEDIKTIGCLLTKQKTKNKRKEKTDTTDNQVE